MHEASALVDAYARARVVRLVSFIFRMAGIYIVVWQAGAGVDSVSLTVLLTVSLNMLYAWGWCLLFV